MRTDSAEPNERTAPGAGAPSRSRRLEPVAWAAAYLLLTGIVQFAFVSIPYDADTAYHVAVGRMIRAHGILHAFPWTPFSWLSEHYADKELLLHLLLVPLAGLSWITAAKIVGTVVGAGALLAVYGVLRASGVRWAGLWALLPLLASPVFLFRFSLVRPHLFSIALCAVVLWSAARGRPVALAIASAIFPWAYVAWHLPVVLVVIVEAVRAISGQRLRWRPLVIAAAGIVVGVALHPNSLNLVRFNWIVVADVLVRNAWGGRPGFSLGAEFEPFTIGQWMRLLALSVVLLAAALAVSWRKRRTDPTPLAFGAAALAFGILTVRTARFAEYLVPLSCLTFALARRWIPWRWVGLAVATVALAYSGAETARVLRGLGEKEDRLPPEIADRMRARIPPGAQVFTCDWGHTGTLMLALPERRFIVALDPTLAYLKDPERYALWYQLTHDPPPHTADAIRTAFGARYVVCFSDDWNKAFNDRLPFEAGVQTVLLTDYWSVYDLGDATAGR